MNEINQENECGYVREKGTVCTREKILRNDLSMCISKQIYEISYS